MTIEQLLCPAVIRWEAEFRKKLNESNIEMSDDEIADEFDKWLIENEDLVNKSVDDNIEHINETIERNRQKLLAVNESIFDNFEDDGDSVMSDKEDEPITGDTGDETVTSSGEKVDPDEPEETRSVTGTIKLLDKKDSKYNIFGFINDFYDMIEEEHTNEMTHKNILRKLDVSSITNMAALFAFANLPNIDLSSWNTSRVRSMEGMFYKSTFNNDSICSWDVSECADFKNMFLFCPFNQSLKKWTPKFVERKFRTSDGTIEMRTVRADLPVIGGTEDETRAIAKTFRRGLFKSMQDEEKEEEAVSENKNVENMNNQLKHIVDYDAFVNEGKFSDFIHKGVEKVKNFFKGVALKLGDMIAFFSESGDIYPAVSSYLSLNAVASGVVPGVKAFCDVDNEYLDNVEKEAHIVESPEYYGIVDKDSVEYRNYETFKGMIEEHYQKYGDTGMFHVLNESDFKRVGFTAADGGVVARDIDSDDLREILEDLVENVPAYKGDNHGGAVFIWGAPGIGKSSIPKAIVKAWNKAKGDTLHKKALMVVQCGDLTIDGFSLPIPIEKTIGEYLDERPILKDKVAAQGVSSDLLEKIKKNMHKISTEAPKTWLPAFKMNATQEEINILNDIANGYLDIKNKEGKIVKTETTEGGILLFDEFFRADENVFKIMMQIILNREYSGYMLGNKWGILCCSNRPNDDEEVRAGFEKTGAVVGTRMLAGAYNFIPSFDEWKKWAVSDGGFDPITLEFLKFDKDPENGEYTNWHTIRPDEYIQKGKTAWPTPRTWSALMNELNLYKDNHGYSSVVDIPDTKLRRIADGIIGEDMAVRYVTFLKSHAESIAVDAKAVLEDPDYKIPSSSKCSDVVRQIENYVTIKYDADDIPDVSLLMNMFNNLNNTYSGSKDNFVKLMHLNIMKHLKVRKIKSNFEALKEYLLAADDRYHYSDADFR